MVKQGVIASTEFFGTAFASVEAMRQIMKNMLALQKLQLQTKPLSLESERAILALREHVPEPTLHHFDRLIARGKRGVAIVHNGTCGQCHLRLPSGTMAALIWAKEIQRCDNCGRYLHLADQEPPNHADLPEAAHAQTRAVAKPTRQKAHAHAT